jgi:hypothetical protein
MSELMTGLETVRLLGEILEELKRANAERYGATSSVEIEDLVGKAPKVTTKNYLGSPAPVDEAIADHARAKHEADEHWRRDWQATITELQAADRGG